MRSISLAAALFVAAAGLAFAQVDPATQQPTAPATTEAPEATAPAPATTETTTQEAQQPEHAGDRVICRTVASTESRLRRQRQRICGTRTQWEQMQDQNADQIRNTGSVQGRTG
jgi:hypothetical protein